jgi:putative membrane protein
MPPPAPPFDVKPSVGDHFAWLRTQMALQNTLMAAVRTAVSLIGFGFTVAQFFEKMQGKHDTRILAPEAPRNFGLLLIAAGVISLAIFTWEYHAARTYLWSPPYRPIAPTAPRPLRNSAYITAFAVLLIGLAAFGSVLMRF